MEVRVPTPHVRTVLLALTLVAVPLTATTTAHAAPEPADAGRANRAAPLAPSAATATGLDDPAKKEIAMQLVSSAENSSLDWKAQYGYI
ncbi:hypothetical protein GT002_39335, partial [Streptomyces sp. SID4917]|nr:hypothetical protein [Streptomyces sp. SID4917]